MHGFPFLFINLKQRGALLLAAAFMATFCVLTSASANSTANHTKPGFNCAKGHSKNEQLICNDPELAKIDYELSLIYAQAKLMTHNSAAFKKTNNEEWLWREKNCHDKNCLLQWYANRHNQLSQVLNKHGASSSAASSTPSSDVVLTAQPDVPSPSRQQAEHISETISQQIVTVPLMRKPILWISIIGIILVISLAWDAIGTDKAEKKRARMIATAVNSNIGEFLEQHGRGGRSGASVSDNVHDPKKWDREKRRFIEEMVKPSLTDCTPLSITDVDRLCLIIDYTAWGLRHDNHQYRFRGDLDDSEHGGYRRFCARVLKQYGWKVKSVRISKPDGYLLATRRSHVAAIVCKSQSIPVGMEALREARGLQVRHNARKAVVISNAPFTTSVEREAESCGALLVNHLALSMLATMMEL